GALLILMRRRKRRNRDGKLGEARMRPSDLPKQEPQGRGEVVPLRRRIHPTAIVDPRAELGAGVEVGPYAVIEGEVIIGDGTTIGPHAMIQNWTIIGRENKIHAGVVLGCEPQDLKYQGEKTTLVIGDRNIIREYASISRGTAVGRGETRIGDD